MRKRFFNNNETLFSAKNRIAHRRDLASPTSEFLGVVIFTIILYFGGQLVLNEDLGLTGSLFIAYLGLFYNLINPTKTLSTSFSNMRKGAAAINRIMENEVLLIELSANCRIAREELNWQNEEQKLIQFYKKVFSS